MPSGAKGQHYGVHMGVHEPASRKTYEELRPFADTRNRLFNIDYGEGTFNAGELNNPEKPSQPTGQYCDKSRRVPPTPADTAWPPLVRQGSIYNYQGQTLQNECARKFGSLGRNIVGCCTVKDQYHTYYGAENKYYGSNSGTKNHAIFR